LRLQT
jgi:hypothetical protein